MNNPTIVPSTKPLKVGDRFAVYGTLKKGHGNYYNLGLDKRAKFIRQDRVEGLLYHLGGFPGLIQLPDKEKGTVLVEVYEVTEEGLPHSLDGLEGYRIENPERSFYIRAPIQLLYSKGTVDIYYYNGDVSRLNLVENGDWGR